MITMNLSSFKVNPSSKRLQRRAALIFTVCLYTLPATPQAANEETSIEDGCKGNEAIRFRGGTARLENDLFTGTDKNYTNGVAFTAVSHDIPGELSTECLPTPVRLHAKLIKFLNPSFWSGAENFGHTQNVVVKFGQSMYTPEDPFRTDLIEDDRPYAGVLYVGMSWNRREYTPRTNTEILDTREITLGIIGPSSLAEESQNVVHDLIGSDRFLGWDHQLKDEPALQFAVDRKFKDYQGTGVITPGLSADSIRTMGMRLGNIETSLTLGIEGRIGWNLPNDFGTYPIRPGAENRPPSPTSALDETDGPSSIARRVRPGVQLFGTLQTKLVAHDFSLDGNLFRSSHSVTRRPWVAQASVGIAVHGLVAGHGVKFAAMRVYRTREFEEQGENQDYGSIALSIEY